jgi:fumarate reductase flavoprotein subunit
MTSNKHSNAETLEKEIVVVGGGAAGLAAAVAAGEREAGVLLLEKRTVLGGNAAMAEGFFAAESQAQRRMLIDAARDHLFRLHMDYSHWKINPRIVRALVDKSGDTVRWLEEKGVKFDWIPPLYPNQVPLVWHYPKKGGAAVVKALVKSCETLGVVWVRQTAAMRILLSEKGDVIGVLATTKDKELKITARSVIIATGGYAGNKELLRRYCSSYTEALYCMGLPHMGDGLQMVTEIGAATEGLGLLHFSGPFFPGSLHLTSVAKEPDVILVNREGERFTDENLTNFERANTVDRQPGKICYALFDAKIKKRLIEEGLHGFGHRIGPSGFPRQIKLTDLEKELQQEVGKGMVMISESWGEIAQWIGIPPQALEATITEYNFFCDQGYDESFSKERRYLQALRTAPYYAIKCHSSFLGTIGGIKINHHMEVLNHQDRPIPGLYAVGVDTGGWEGDTYNGMLTGHTFGFSLNSGRIAGENAVKYISGK